MRPLLRPLALCLAAAAAPLAAIAAATPASAPPCREVTHEGARHTVCEVDVTKHTVKLYWKRPDGQPYAHLGRLPNVDAGPDGKAQRKLRFAINGGMFKADLSPVGLYVEGGREHVKASTTKGPGNFHLKPNGVFWVGGGKAGVAETGAYLKSKPAADIATQSGPMLVISGKLHPLFVRAEASQKMRDGVGVTADGRTAIFVISEDPVSFAAFGRLFRDVLKTPNALFLDGGSAPALYSPAMSRGGNFLSLGPMLGIYGP